MKRSFYVNQFEIFANLCLNFVSRSILCSAIVMPYLTHYGTREQQERYIPPMTSGHCIASIAMTEPDAGSDLQGIRWEAARAWTLA